MPVITLVVYGLLLLVPRLEPQKNSDPAFQTVYGKVIFAVLLLFTGLHVLFIYKSMGRPADMTLFVPLLTGLFFSYLGFLIRNAPPNPVFCMNLPGLQEKPELQAKANREMGAFFMGLGFLLALGSLLRTPWVVIGMLAVLVFGTPAVIIRMYIRANG
ncbi:hypothetical protein GF324_08955 [bacterium]|nr:hypothetical protein [bacterium]